MSLESALRDRIVASVERRLRRADRIHQDAGPLPVAARRGAHHPGLRLPLAARFRPHDGAVRDGPRRDRAPPGRVEILRTAFRCADRGRHPPAAAGDRTLADPAGACRRRADRRPGALVPPAVRAGHRGRLDVRARVGRHEGRARGEPVRPEGAAPHRAAAGRDGLCPVGGGGGIDRQRRADDASARLPRRRRADPGAGGREAGARQCRRALVPDQGAGPRRACARDGRRRERDRRRLPGGAARCARSKPNGTRARPGARISRTSTIRST